MKRYLLILIAVAGIGAAGAWLFARTYRTLAPSTGAAIPTTAVKRSDITLSVAAKGSLRGGNSEMLTAPLTGGGEMHITELKKTGELVEVGETVVEFDPTDQEYKLKEAQADLAESKLKVVQAEAQAEADTEEAKYLLQKAESDVRVSELDVRKNPILPAITAKQNDLLLQASKDRSAQLRTDLANRGDTNKAAIAVQKAAVGKAEIQVVTAQKNIDALVVKATHSGYVAIRSNQSGNFFFGGMTLPDYQVGDTVRGGMAVAEIPDLNNWEVSASFGELDRGHLSVGQPVSIAVVALPNQKFTGKIADLGGTAGPPWNRHFECKIHLDNPTPTLHPGMSVNVVVTTDVLQKVLWLPAQAVFESGSRTFVYVPSGGGFSARDVKLLRRSESRVVLSDLPEGQLVALADPEAESKKKETGSRGPALTQVKAYFVDLVLAAQNLLSQKTRTILTALGIIFGVGAVIGMLAIGAGARDESLRFIEQLGVRNVLVESRPATSDGELQQRRRASPGLNERDVRIIAANLDGMSLISATNSLRPAKVLPKPAKEGPELRGVRPSYAQIHNWRLEEGSFFTDADDGMSAAVCVLAENAKVGVLGYGPAVGKYIKLNDTWLRVVGVLQSQLASGSQNLAAGAASDVNNVVYVPLNTFKYRFWDMGGGLKDELGGVDIQLKIGADSIAASKIVVAILNSTHHNTPDFSVTIPAELLAQQQRAQVIFTYVMVAIAAISLLVGGIGIMNIVLATVLERTREIGIRRAIGARRADIVRQFLMESVLISVGGGLVGIAFGYFLSWLIATAADWKTIVTTSSIVIAFGVSVVVGVVFGIYPAVKASRIDPIEALRYE